MTKTEAIELLREYAEHQASLWVRTPEGQAHMIRFNEAIKGLSSDCDKPNTDLADAVIKAMRRAWFLGQEYWRLADSESYRDNMKSDEIGRKFEALMKETRDRVWMGIGE